MPTVLERLNADLRVALKSRDAVRADVLRMLLTRLKEKETEKGRGTVDEAVALQVLSTYAKQRKDGAEQFAAAGRQDLHDKEMKERDIVLEYLPRMLDDAEIRQTLGRIIEETGANGAADIGKVMKLAMEQMRGKADGGRVQQLARELLGA